MATIALTGGDIEFVWVGTEHPGRPTIVMLHEGLGSVSLWREFPRLLAEATRCRVLVYSRHGYGRSAPLPGPRAVSYMHDETLLVLPELLEKLGVAEPLLFGHSDGGSIALIHAAKYPVTGVIALAPHVFVENLCVASIAAAKVTYQTTDLRDKLARHHRDADAAFWGWNDIWLHPDFRSWNIESCLAEIQCPVLVIQGGQDEYGTDAQMQRIFLQARAVELLYVPECRHSPHRDQPHLVLEKVARWTQDVIRGPKPA
jgi:pimeloyl-ACP methyl ester carboxylesterase